MNQIQSPWRWWQYVPPKHWKTHLPHGIETQMKTINWSTITMKTWKHTKLTCAHIYPRNLEYKLHIKITNLYWGIIIYERDCWSFWNNGLEMGQSIQELIEDGEYDMMYWPHRLCKRTSSLEGKQREKSTEVTMKSYVPASLGVWQKVHYYKLNFLKLHHLGHQCVVLLAQFFTR